MADANPISTNRKTNLNLCCLCPKDKRGEDLKSLSGHISQNMMVSQCWHRSKINEMPLILDPVRLEYGGGIEFTLTKKSGKILCDHNGRLVHLCFTRGNMGKENCFCYKPPIQTNRTSKDLALFNCWKLI